MKLNFLSYNLRTFDGYGRYSIFLMQALERAGVEVTGDFIGIADAPVWVQDRHEIDWDRPTISCLPPFYLRKLPKDSGPHWLLTMTEGSQCPPGWADIINEAGIERVIVPCEHNAEAFRSGGIACSVTVIPGGTCPTEFEVRTRPRSMNKPYTFLALADRGKRKGWSEVYNAFYMAFGSAKDTGPDKVRLVIKCRPKGNDLIDNILAKADLATLDPRIVYQRDDVRTMREVYEQIDCFVIPSRSEGWGMPHREAAMMGLPVITQAYSGMDDGHTHEWAMVVKGGHMEPVESPENQHIAGEWRICDRQELADRMFACYAQPWVANQLGQCAARWLREHQTWDHSATAMVDVMKAEGLWH